MKLQDELGITFSGSTPDQVSDYVRRFLDEAVPAHITGQSSNAKGQISATVFLDYVPLEVEFSIESKQDDADATVVVFKHSSQNDIIRFQRVFDHLLGFLQSLGLQFTTLRQSAGGLVKLIDDFQDFEFMDDMTVDEEALWAERVDLVQADMKSLDADVREEAIQLLARWVAESPLSHGAAAKMFVKSQFEATLLAGMLSPLAELYPAASALKNMCCGMSREACDVLSNSAVFTVLTNVKMNKLPPVVARELAMALQSLKVWKAYSSKLTGEKPSSSNHMASNSTRCTNLEHIDDLDDFSDDDQDEPLLESKQQEVAMKSAKASKVQEDMNQNPLWLQAYNQTTFVDDEPYNGEDQDDLSRTPKNTQDMMGPLRRKASSFADFLFGEVEAGQAN